MAGTRAPALGATGEGAPGLRPRHHTDDDGACLRDPDGNKLCVVRHAPGEPVATN